MAKSGSQRRHVAVIDPACRTAELDSFNMISRISQIPCTYHMPGIFGMDSLTLCEDSMVGIAILGSSASVHDGLPWQGPFNEWLKRFLGKVPTIGFCYGHQLIAHLMGGAVGYLHKDQFKEQGLRQVDIVKNPWGPPTSGKLVVSHKEIVTKLPPDFEVIAKSPLVAIDGMAHKKLPIWGFQPHPEATAGFVLNQHAAFNIDSNDATVFSFGHILVGSFLAFVAAGSRQQ